MKMKAQPLNYDIYFYSSVNFLSFDLRCNLILRLYIQIFVQIFLETAGVILAILSTKPSVFYPE